MKLFFKYLKKYFSLILGVGLIAYSYNATTPQDRDLIVGAIKESHIGLVLISLVCAVLSHVIRAVRWNLLLEPLGYKFSFFTTSGIGQKSPGMAGNRPFLQCW